MARIFLSHSSARNAEAVAIRDWLVASGWDDLFLDIDSKTGLVAGERWQVALKAAAGRCEAVLFLVSPEWAASKWCLAEFLLAKQMNKRIFGIIVASTPVADLPVEMTAEWQLVDLTVGAREYHATVATPPANNAVSVTFAKQGLERLRDGLLNAGLDAKYFAWPPENDPGRAPYRGLKPLEAEDAGILFGRDGSIVEAIDRLRGLREAAPPRLFVILSASGAGKSSFMRAGLLPRLARDDRHFLPLPVIRPERAVISGEGGLVASLEAALRQAGAGRSRADVREAVRRGAAGCVSLLGSLLDAKVSTLVGNRKPVPPTLILPIDQAEELFFSDAAGEAETFLLLLREILVSNTPIVALFTIRSDGYERLQTASALDGLRQQTFSLPPMSKSSYAEVVRGPARRLEGSDRALKIEESLVDVLLADIEEGNAKDALPLLAFTLERLYCEHGGDGDLRLSEYQQIGRIQGAIEAGVAQAFNAADADPKIPKDHTIRLALLRRGLIPWLAGFDPETGVSRRRVAKLSEIPEDARPLVALLVEQRLLATDVVKYTNEVTIEPAHEALLRRWGLLQRWLDEDRDFLMWRHRVQITAAEWRRSDHDSDLLLRGSLLSEAERWYAQRRTDLATGEGELIEASVRSRDRTRWLARFATGTALVACTAIVIGIVQYAYAQRLKQPILPEMVEIRPEPFVMGPVEGDPNITPLDLATVNVRIAKPFKIGKYEVTFAEYERFVRATGRRWPSDFGFGAEDRPVVDVSWIDASGYARWLSDKTGGRYRLPTEAEWEYSARAGTRFIRYWGNDDADACQYANVYDKAGGVVGREKYGFNYPEHNCDDGYGETAPRGKFKPNAFGLHDMLGNVWEWVQDCWQPGPRRSPPADGTEGVPANGKDCTHRIKRGGAWDNSPSRIRISYRSQHKPEDRQNDAGFRLAQDLD